MNPLRRFVFALPVFLSLAVLTACEKELPIRHRFAEPADQAKIVAGMPRDQVTALLGEPWQVQKFRNQPGDTLVWQVRESPKKTFDVDLDAQGLVRSASVRDMPVAEN